MRNIYERYKEFRRTIGDPEGSGRDEEILEKQQAEIEELYQIKNSLEEQLEESLQLNEQLTKQNRKLQEQIHELQN